MHDSDFDDHEPGDVNGNVDPAYAKKAKTQGRPPRVREPRAPREPRARAALPVAASAAPDANAAPAGVPVSSVASGDKVLATPSAEAGDAAEQQRARGPRRNRRGGRGRNARGERVDRPLAAQGMAGADNATDNPVFVPSGADGEVTG